MRHAMVTGQVHTTVAASATDWTSVNDNVDTDGRTLAGRGGREGRAGRSVSFYPDDATRESHVRERRAESAWARPWLLRWSLALRLALASELRGTCEVLWGYAVGISDRWPGVVGNRKSHWRGSRLTSRAHVLSLSSLRARSHHAARTPHAGLSGYPCPACRPGLAPHAANAAAAVPPT